MARHFQSSWRVSPCLQALPTTQWFCDKTGSSASIKLPGSKSCSQLTISRVESCSVAERSSYSAQDDSVFYMAAGLYQGTVLRACPEPVEGC